MALPERQVAHIYRMRGLESTDNLLHFPTGVSETVAAEIDHSPSVMDERHVISSDMYLPEYAQGISPECNGTSVTVGERGQKAKRPRYIIADRHDPWTVMSATSGSTGEDAAQFLDKFGKYIDRPLERYLGKISRSEHMASDVAQITRMKIWTFYSEHSELVASMDAERTRRWFFTVAKRAFLDEKRRLESGIQEIPEASIRPTLQNQEGEIILHTWNDILAEHEPTPEDTFIIKEFGENIKRILEMIPEDQRNPLILADIEGLDYAEIARILGINIGTVKSRLSRARAKFRGLYSKES